MERERINLRTLFTVYYDDLPEMVDALNCIYKITNLLDGKSYIGQAKWFYGRFTGNGFSHRSALVKGCNYLYNAIRKHKSRNFEVEILEKNLEEKDLNDREIYWISYYETYYTSGKGYNLTSGGDNCEHLHTEEAFETQRRNHGGVLAFHTEEAYENNRRNHGGVLAMHTEEAFETNRRNHGGVLAWNTEEALETQRRNHDGVLACQTPEAYETNRRNHGGVLAMHTEEAFETNRRNHGGVLAWHTEEAIKNCIKSNWFRRFDINYSNALEDYEESTGYAFYLSSSWIHLDKLIEDIEDLRQDQRWTSEHERIYQELLKVPEMIERYKL